MTDFRLCLVTDRTRCDSLATTVDNACSTGVRAVQLREKDLDTRSLFELAGDLRRVTSGHHATLLVNNRPDIAMATGSDGVHCPEAGFPPPIARQLLGADALIGVSCHSLQGARAAERSGADLVFYGPVFQTASKADHDGVGLASLAAVCAGVTIPVFAIGGVTPARAAACIEHGAAGVAVISAILEAADTRVSVADFEKALGGL